jgi:hypothetical protein
MEGAAKKSAGAGSSTANAPPKRKTTKSQSSKSKDTLCHQQPALATSTCSPPQAHAADITPPPVAVVHTDKKISRSVSMAVSISGGTSNSGTTITSATTEDTDEVSPTCMGSEAAYESVPASSPMNLEKILEMEEKIAPLPKDSKPPKISRRSIKSKNKSAQAATAKSALPFLLGYEQMVRTQDAEDCATAIHLRPIFARLRYLGGDTTVAPEMPSSNEKNSGNTLPTSKMGSSDASVNSTGTYGTTVTTATDRTDAEREADALSYLSSYSGQHVDKCDGTILSFSAIAISLYLLSSKKPNEEEMVLDRSLMLLLETIVEATAEVEDTASIGGVTFPEFMSGYKTIANAMLTIQRFPSTTAEGQQNKAQTRYRAHQTIQSFVRVPPMTRVPDAVEEPKEEALVAGKVTQDGEIGDSADTNVIDSVQGKKVTSVNPAKALLLHVVIELACLAGASTMWVKHVPLPQNMSSTAEANESEVAAFAPEEAQTEQPLTFSQRSIEHFALRTKVRAADERNKRWMKSTHKCQESLETLQADFEAASFKIIMEMIDKDKDERSECSPPEFSGNDLMSIEGHNTIAQGVDVIIQPQRKEYVKAHILSAMGGATLTTLASKVLVDGSATVISSAALAPASPMALVMGTARRQILSVLGGATMSSLVSRTLAEGAAKAVTSTAANSLAATRIVSAAIGSPFALIMALGTVALVVASVVEKNSNAVSINA